MSDYPVKKIKTEIKTSEKQKSEAAETSPYSANSFISFRYSYKSVSYLDGKTHIKAKQERFENGKFESEEFEGTTDGDIYNNTVKALRQTLFQNFSSLFNQFGFLQPFSKKENKER